MFDRNKQRLYVCLYIRGGSIKMPGGEDQFHWALVVGPKVEDKSTVGRKFHAKEDMQKLPYTWTFTEEETGTLQSLRLLTRVLVAKVKDMSAVADILHNVPIRAGQVDGWNCVGWAKEALETLGQSDKALGTSVLEWQKVRDAAMDYSLQKIASHRFDGKPADYVFDKEVAPTYDLLTMTETIP